MSDELRHGIVAEFDDADAMLDAVRRLRAQGYRRLDTFAPHDVPEADDRLGNAPPRLGLVAAGAGAAGAALAYAVQWWTSVVDYPLNAGGRPPHAVPAFLPSTFETMGLAAAVAVFLALLLALRLPRLWHPVFEVEGFDRATSDRYWVGVDARDPRFHPAHTTQALRALGPRRVVWVGGGA